MRMSNVGQPKKKKKELREKYNNIETETGSKVAAAFKASRKLSQLDVKGGMLPLWCLKKGLDFWAQKKHTQLHENYKTETNIDRWLSGDNGLTVLSELQTMTSVWAKANEKYLRFFLIFFTFFWQQLQVYDSENLIENCCGKVLTAALVILIKDIARSLSGYRVSRASLIMMYSFFYNRLSTFRTL